MSYDVVKFLKPKPIKLSITYEWIFLSGKPNSLDLKLHYCMTRCAYASGYSWAQCQNEHVIYDQKRAFYCHVINVLVHVQKYAIFRISSSKSNFPVINDRIAHSVLLFPVFWIEAQRLFYLRAINGAHLLT